MLAPDSVVVSVHTESWDLRFHCGVTLVPASRCLTGYQEGDKSVGHVMIAH